MFDISQMTYSQIRREYVKNKEFQYFLHNMISSELYEKFYQDAEDDALEYPDENINIDEHIEASIKLYVNTILLKNETLSRYLETGE